jgi:hypothetical protein
MPGRTSPPGERISRLEAMFVAYEKYSHERWHDLNNDLQLIVGLPLQLTRDLAKMEGKLESKMDGRLAAIEMRLSAIEQQRQQVTGAKQLGVWLVQTLFAAIAAVGTVFALRGAP